MFEYYVINVETVNYDVIKTVIRDCDVIKFNIVKNQIEAINYFQLCEKHAAWLLSPT